MGVWIGATKNASRHKKSCESAVLPVSIELRAEKKSPHFFKKKHVKMTVGNGDS